MIAFPPPWECVFFLISLSHSLVVVLAMSLCQFVFSIFALAFFSLSSMLLLSSPIVVNLVVACFRFFSFSLSNSVLQLLAFLFPLFALVGLFPFLSFLHLLSE